MQHIGRIQHLLDSVRTTVATLHNINPNLVFWTQGRWTIEASTDFADALSMLVKARADEIRSARQNS